MDAQSWHELVMEIEERCVHSTGHEAFVRSMAHTCTKRASDMRFRLQLSSGILPDAFCASCVSGLRARLVFTVPVTDELSSTIDGRGAAWSWGDKDEDNEYAAAAKDADTLPDTIGIKKFDIQAEISCCAMEVRSDDGGRREKYVNRPDSFTESGKWSIFETRAETNDKY